MTNPRDPEGLMPDADVTGGPGPAAGRGASAFDDATERLAGADPLAGRTDVDDYGSDPDLRFPGDAEDSSVSTADAAASATTPARDPGE